MVPTAIVRLSKARAKDDVGMSSTITASYRSSDETMKLATEDDVSRFLARLLEGAVTDPDNTCAWLYLDARPVDDDGIADHEMRVGVIPDVRELKPDKKHSVTGPAWTLGFTDIRGSMYVKGRDSGLQEVPLFTQGHDESFPHDSLVDSEVVKSAIMEALRTGERPANVTWSPTR
jgi:immunity protein Imm1 of predicted polymorphic toxin system